MTVVDRELLFEIVQRVERVTGVKALLILPVAALCLAVVPGRIGTDQFMPNLTFSNMQQTTDTDFECGASVETVVLLEPERTLPSLGE